MRRIANLTAQSILFCLCVCVGGSADACSAPHSAEETARELRLMIEKSDYVIIGRVSHVLRRRWSEDDTRPIFHPKWIEYAERSRAGEDVGSDQYIVNWVEFAEATAYIEVTEELFWTGLNDGPSAVSQHVLLPIDLLRPFSVAGHGPCESFPQTCPWDIQSGEFVALAVQENRFGPFSALVCSKTPRLSSDEREKIRRESKFTTKYDALLPYLPQFR